MPDTPAPGPAPVPSQVEHLIRLARLTQVPPKPGKPGGYSTINSALASSTRVPQFEPKPAAPETTAPPDRELD